MGDTITISWMPRPVFLNIQQQWSLYSIFHGEHEKILNLMGLSWEQEVRFPTGTHLNYVLCLDKDIVFLLSETIKWLW